MPLQSLNHFSIRTGDLAASRRFYVEVLGLRDGARPPFSFPGHWLYCGEQPVVHLIGSVPGKDAGLGYLGDRAAGTAAHGEPATGAVDHIAFLAADLAGLRRRLSESGLHYRERTVPLTGQHQLFVTDPNGVLIEINFAATEAAHSPAA